MIVLILTQLTLITLSTYFAPEEISTTPKLFLYPSEKVILCCNSTNHFNCISSKSSFWYTAKPTDLHFNIFTVSPELPLRLSILITETHNFADLLLTDVAAG